MPDNIHPSVLLNVQSPRLKRHRPTTLGPGAVLRSGTVIYESSMIGAGLATGHHVVIREQNQIGRQVSIWNHSTVDYGCRIGHRVKIHSNCYIAQYTILESDVFLAPGVILGNDLYPGAVQSAQRMQGPWIGKGARIGINATILPYVRIGRNALVGAGAVVTRDVPANTVVWGNPARVHKACGELDLSSLPARLRARSRPIQ